MDRYGHVSFCDDIRREASGQRSLIGCYSSEMIVKSKLPYIIPKFCIDITFYSARSAPFERLEYQVFLPDQADVPFKSVEPKKNPDIWKGKLLREDGTSVVIRQRTALYFVGMPIACEGSVRVFAVVDQEKIRIGTLHITVPNLSREED